MAKTKPGYRVVIQLDPRVALEAILLNRLERIPATRRQEWLRGLLVQGFRAECQALRGAPDNTTRCPPTGFKNWQAGEVQKRSTAEPTPVVRTDRDCGCQHDQQTLRRPGQGDRVGQYGDVIDNQRTRGPKTHDRRFLPEPRPGWPR